MLYFMNTVDVVEVVGEFDGSAVEYEIFAFIGKRQLNSCMCFVGGYRARNGQRVKEEQAFEILSATVPDNYLDYEAKLEPLESYVI